jgi:DNA-binding transcriptional MerR regulator
MAYTVNKIAGLSGVSVRTLRFYDELGLLKPAYHGANGYRYYEQEQLLMLQQILFFRELGFELKKIQAIIGRADFNKIAALKAHRKVLQADAERVRRLLKTIDQTIEHLKGTKKMKDTEMYQGFDQKKQAEYEKQLIDRYGGEMKKHIADSHKKIKHWTKQDWQRSSQEFEAICQGLVAVMSRNIPTEADEAQTLVGRHFNWLKQFWTPNRESYIGHGDFIVQTELRKAYDAYDPALAGYLASGIKVFAARQLA